MTNEELKEQFNQGFMLVSQGLQMLEEAYTIGFDDGDDDHEVKSHYFRMKLNMMEKGNL
jgi:hypothetical protein